MDNSEIRILLVEDNPGDAEYLAELLSEERDPAFSILHVQRLSDALTELRNKTFDAILLDLGLSDSQGMDTLLRVRKQSPIPVIVLTGLADEEFALRAIQTGADDYLIKGQVNSALVARTLRYTLQRRHAEEALRESSQRLQLAIGAGRMVAWAWDHDKNRLSVSDNFEEVFGRPPISRSDEALALVHPEDRERHRSEIVKAIETSDVYQSEFRIVRPDTAGLVWIEERAKVLKSASGKLLRITGVAVDITERKRAEQAIRESEERYRVVTESAQDAIFTIDTDSTIVLTNPAAERIFGYPREEMEGRSLTMLMPELLREPHREAVRKMAATGARRLPSGTVELPGLHRDGREIPLEISYGDFIRDGKRFFIGIVRDISERKKTEEAIRRSEAILKQAGQMANLGAWQIEISDSENLGASPLLWSDQVYRIFGYEPDSVAVTNQLFFERVHPEDREKVSEAVSRAISMKQPYSLEHRIIRPDGTERIVFEHAEIIFNEQGRPLRMVGAVQDVTDRKKAEELIEYQAYHDLLTGLPNRAQLMLKLELEVAQAARNETRLAVVHLDLDRFKVINDTLGHSIGDRMILAVAERLGGIIRKSDTLARVGSDEFIILLADLKAPEEAARVAVQIVSGLRKTFPVEGRDLYITTSVGISVFPDDSRDPEALLSNADIAVSHVKKMGRNNYQFFNPSINIRTLERLLLESSLRQTIERNQLELYYQPQVDLRTGEVICVEALVRWNHPDLGMLLPAQFIPIAEEIGFITAIDEWALRTACAQNRSWHEAGNRPLCVTVNMSSQQFEHPDLIRLVSSVVERAGISPAFLDIEVTESTAMRDIDLAIPNLKGLNRLGVHLSIDDFGTGYSSLNYLKRFPVQTLKIDQSFIRGVATDADDQAIVKAVIAIGHNLRLKVLAEGVETEDQLSFLRHSDCDEMQGFLFSEPLPAGEISRKYG